MVTNFSASNFAQSAINSIAHERAMSAARELLRGEAPNAWDAASEIASACNALAATGPTKSAIFSIAAKVASDAFCVARVAAGALASESKWVAFASAASVARGALEFNVWGGSGKSETAKEVKASKDAQQQAHYALAVDAGMVPAVSTPESLNLSLTRELVSLTAEHTMLRGTLTAAQARLIPLDALTNAHSEKMSEMTLQIEKLLLENNILRLEIDSLKVVKPAKKSKTVAA